MMPKFNPDNWQWKTKDGVFLIEDIDNQWLKNIIGVLRKRLLAEEDEQMQEYGLQEVVWLEEQLSSRDSPQSPAPVVPLEKRHPDYLIGRKEGRLDSIEYLRAALNKFEKEVKGE